jgi:probable phosphoglycerate mutase
MTSLCVIVRHGNTFAPDEPARRIGAGTDLPLVESGRLQAVRLGEHFRERGWRFDRVLASPLRRTRESTALILAAMEDAPPIETRDWLAEIDHGPDENRSETEVIARIGEAALATWDKDAIAPPGWHVDGPAREAAWRAFFASAPKEMTLLVTSNGAARFGLRADEGLARQAAALPSLKLATGAYGLIALDGGAARLAAWNQRP